jgi:hypothetical protein
MIDKGHPIHSLRAQLLHAHPDLVLEFSRYIHLGYGKTLSREVFHATASEVTEEWLDENLSLLESEQELALHSRVIHAERIYHIPMVDFVNVTSEDEVKETIGAIDALFASRIWLYHSGQSLHGYYFQLIDDYRWIEYLGKLLLCNQNEKSEKDIVDQRWVAHSLEHRFSALRWSHNSNKYLSMPIDWSMETIYG